MTAIAVTWNPTHLQQIAAMIAPWLRGLTKASPEDALAAEDVIDALNGIAAELGAPPPPPLPADATPEEIRAAFEAAPPRIEQQDRIEAIEGRIDAVRELLGGIGRGMPTDRYAAVIILHEIIAHAVAARQALSSPASANGQ